MPEIITDIPEIPKPGGSFGELDDYLSENYGVEVYQTINDLIKDPFIKDKLSNPTLMSVGSYLVSAYEIGSAAINNPQIDISQIITFAVDIALDIAAAIATEVVGEIFTILSDLIPLIFALIDAAMSLVDGVIAQEKQEYAQKLLTYIQECRAKAELYEPLATGREGEYNPVDFFIQARRVEITIEGNYRYEVLGRIPYIGRMLELITEQQWGVYFTQSIPNYNELIGVPQKVFNDISNIKDIGKASAWCTNAVWPAINQYAPNFRRLRRAIIQSSPILRKAQGKTGGDSGHSLWPIYMDLLYAAIRVQQWPLEYIYGKSYPYQEKGFIPVAPLNEPVLRAMYSSGPAQSGRMGWPFIIGFLAQLLQGTIIGENMITACPKGQVWPYYRPLQLFGMQPDKPRKSDMGLPIKVGCYGDPTTGLEAILKMVDGWRYSVDPVDLNQTLAQQQLSSAYENASILAKKKIKELGLDTATSGITDRKQAQQAISRLSKMGIIGDNEAEKANDAINQGAEPTLWPVIVAGAALGLLLIRRR